tara:strand:- start:841 stop:1239 length:399 start_codon:yes stop_codon:yes gene_type:complete
MDDSYLDKYISPDGVTLYTLQELLNKPIIKDKIYVIKMTKNIDTDIEALRIFLSYFYEKNHINTFYYDFIDIGKADNFEELLEEIAYETIYIDVNTITVNENKSNIKKVSFNLDRNNIYEIKNCLYDSDYDT